MDQDMPSAAAPGELPGELYTIRYFLLLTGPAQPCGPARAARAAWPSPAPYGLDQAARAANLQILMGWAGYGPRCHRTALGRAWKCRPVPARCHTDVFVCQVSNRTAINFLNIITGVITDDWLSV